MPAFLVCGLGCDLEVAAANLGLAPQMLRPFADQSLQAELPDPQGRWRYWPSTGMAMWSGGNAEAETAPISLRRARIEVVPAMDLLLRAGFFCTEMSLLRSAGWSAPLDGRAGLCEMARREPLGVSGWWIDDRGDSARVEIFADGTIWGESALIAERWLLTIAGRELA